MSRVPLSCRVDWPAPEHGARPITLLVVIVNFRTAKLTIDALQSLAAEVRALPGVFVIIADNSSGDGSADAINAAIQHNQWSNWARVVHLPKNGGFAYGNNRGIEAGPAARYVLLLNSDTIVHPGCLKHCIEAMDADPSVGAMSCNILNADGTIQNVCRRFPTPVRSIIAATGLPWKMPGVFGWANTDDLGWDRERTTRDVDWLGGAFVFTRAELLRQLGGLDEDFFFYGEDIEFSFRLGRFGYRRLYKPGAIVTHLGGSSSDPSRMPSAAKNVQQWKGRYLVQRKCWGRLAEAAVRLTDLTTQGLRVMLRTLSAGRNDPARMQHRETLGLMLSQLRSQWHS